MGKYLCRRLDCGKVVKGRIVETEMYPGQVDKASHSFNDKKTGRNGAMFMEPGTAYVYLIYGMYFCFNISAQGISCYSDFNQMINVLIGFSYLFRDWWLHPYPSAGANVGGHSYGGDAKQKQKEQENIE